MALFVFLLIVFGTVSLPALADVRWQSDVQGAMNMARGNNRLVFVEVSAEWCPACRRLDKLLHDKRVPQFLDPHFVSVKLNADDPQGQGLLKKYGVKGIPALFVFGAQGDLKGKMSGAPQDFEGFKHFITKLAGGEEAIAAAGSAGGGSWQGNTMGGAPQQNGFQQFGNFNQGQPYQQQFQQQQMPYAQQPPGGYYQQQFPQGQPPVNYGQPQFQQQPQAGYFPPQYQQPPAMGAPMGTPMGFAQPMQQPGFAQPQGYGAPPVMQQPVGYTPGYAPPAQNPYAPGAYQQGAPSGFSPQQMPMNTQPPQGQYQQFQQGVPQQ